MKKPNINKQQVERADLLLQHAAEDHAHGLYTGALEKARLVVAELEPVILPLLSDAPPTRESIEYQAAATLTHAYNRLNSTGLVVGDFVAVIECGQAGIRIATWISDPIREAQLESNIGSAYAQLRDGETALLHFSRSLELAERHSIDRLIPSLYGALGNVMESIGDHNSALQYALKARQIYEERGVPQEAAGVIHNAGNVYFRLGKLDKAIEAYTQAMALNRQTGNVSWLALNLSNLGVVYAETEQVEIALEYLFQAVDLHERHGFAMDELWANIGGLFARESPLHNADKAEEFLLRSIEQRRASGSRRFEAHEELATLYERQGRLLESLAFLKEARDLERETSRSSIVEQTASFRHQRELAERDRAESISRAEASTTRRLLDAVLPSSISRRMISGEQHIADSYDNVSILFADLVGFTGLSKDLTAETLIVLLNHIFNRFDDIISRNGCEKVKTIGDGYMAVAGAPDLVFDHVDRLARAALEMSGDIPLSNEIRDLLPPGTVITSRIGLHCGPVVCGVIGQQRFVWDVYSDAVNTASRMESTSEPGRIHVSEAFALALRTGRQDPQRGHVTSSDWMLTKRGETELKGKGIMTTYWLES